METNGSKQRKKSHVKAITFCHLYTTQSLPQALHQPHTLALLSGPESRQHLCPLTQLEHLQASSNTWEHCDRDYKAAQVKDIRRQGRSICSSSDDLTQSCDPLHDTCRHKFISIMYNIYYTGTTVKEPKFSRVSN